jgi:hypothetical protein
MEALVSDEFKRRLDAAAERAQARRVAASAEQASNSTAEQRWANTLQAATYVWMNRIRPALGHAVTEANQAIVHDEKMLSIQDGTATHYAAATGTNTELPYADVVAGPLAKSRAPQVAGVLATIPNSRTESIKVSFARNTTRSVRAILPQSVESFRSNIGEVRRSIGSTLS